VQGGARKLASNDIQLIHASIPSSKHNDEEEADKLRNVTTLLKAHLLQQCHANIQGLQQK
jgi:hypothetical protein